MCQLRHFNPVPPGYTRNRSIPDAHMGVLNPRLRGRHQVEAMSVDPHMAGARLSRPQLLNFEMHASVKQGPCRRIPVKRFVHPSFRLEVHEVQVGKGMGAILLIRDFTIPPEPDLRMNPAAVAPRFGRERCRPLLLKVVPQVIVRAGGATARPMFGAGTSDGVRRKKGGKMGFIERIAPLESIWVLKSLLPIAQMAECLAEPRLVAHQCQVAAANLRVGRNNVRGQDIVRINGAYPAIDDVDVTPTNEVIVPARLGMHDSQHGFQIANIVRTLRGKPHIQHIACTRTILCKRQNLEPHVARKIEIRQRIGVDIPIYCWIGAARLKEQAKPGRPGAKIVAEDQYALHVASALTQKKMRPQHDARSPNIARGPSPIARAAFSATTMCFGQGALSALAMHLQNGDGLMIAADAIDVSSRGVEKLMS